MEKLKQEHMHMATLLALIASGAVPANECRERANALLNELGGLSTRESAES